LLGVASVSSRSIPQPHQGVGDEPLVAATVLEELGTGHSGATYHIVRIGHLKS